MTQPGNTELDVGDVESFPWLSDIFAPHWTRVRNRAGALRYFRDLACDIARHAMSCADMDCRYNRAIMLLPRPTLFVQALTDRLTFFEQMTDAQKTAQDWMERDCLSIQADARFSAFRTAFDAIVLEVMTPSSNLLN